ncbi:hypothetical protein [uncultured Desulfosarcina sp.]|uniref:hypothetical protein n=1 Tax=uncultured Desulfosarcina sp. TaxID=218289 RepID=UPI0029C99D95|nr:hypothetical protein [uncultured Desulfosarcina sp.]
MLNPYRRSICLPDKLGACLVTGTEKVRCGYGNGDCLLLDFHHRVFAVADATERFPQASRLLIERLAAAIAETGPPRDENTFNALLERVWSRQKYIHKTTLSCVVLVNGNDGPAAMLANNGDSTITFLNPSDGKVLFRTRADMNFAGRSKHPNAVTTQRLNGSRPAIVLATDGLAGIGGILSTKITRRPHRIAQWIADRTRPPALPPEIDDIGAIALAPDVPIRETQTIIMGGTRPAAESSFTQTSGYSPTMDRWNSITAWQQSPELLELAGIQIR